MSSPLAQQPIECLDAIALEIDKAKDLLSLSLTCKALYSLVFDRHLRFRVISCRLEDPGSVQVWDLLARNKSLARSVRVLQIDPLAIDGRPDYVIPLDKDSELPELRPDSGAWRKETRKRRRGCRGTRIILNCFLPALRHMTRLTSFSWKLSEAQDHRIFHDDPQGLQLKIYNALNSCKHLRSITIGQPWHNVAETFFEKVNMSGIAELDWCSRIPVNLPPFEQALTHDLQNLESLNLIIESNWSMAPGGLDPILERCMWPKLRRLRLGGYLIRGESGIINLLLARHPSIEDLTLCLNVSLCDSPVASLPNLRVLECGGGNAALILSRSTPGNLRTLRIHRGDSDDSCGTLKRFKRLLGPIRRHTFVEHFVFTVCPMSRGMVHAVGKVLPNLRTLNGCIYDGDAESLLARLQAKEIKKAAKENRDEWEERDSDFLGSLMS